LGGLSARQPKRAESNNKNTSEKIAKTHFGMAEVHAVIVYEPA
jgi:hypothetical protein